MNRLDQLDDEPLQQEMVMPQSARELGRLQAMMAKNSSARSLRIPDINKLQEMEVMQKKIKI